jgi:signal transduction histidine kinase
MSDFPMPLERLRYFQNKVGVDQADFAALDNYRDTFISRKAEFGSYFWEHFWEIERTRPVLEHGPSPRRLEKIKSAWFGRLFEERLNERFIQSLWSSGIKHVQANLDQRYINLGYSLARQFCHKIIVQDIGEGKSEPVALAIDKLLDFCVLVATDSYITMTSRCDRQVIQGIAHQVRNPITVIGGNIRRLQKEVGKESPAYIAYEAVLEENLRLERMVKDVSSYTNLFQTEPHPETVSLSSLLEELWSSLSRGRDMSSINFEMELAPELDSIFADPNDLAIMFHHLLENCLDALDGDAPAIKISTQSGKVPNTVEVEIFNTGDPPPEEELESLFAPFHSSKPKGTGFGLPIADMVARRNLGRFSLLPADGGGTICRIDLPLTDGFHHQ